MNCQICGGYIEDGEPFSYWNGAVHIRCHTENHTATRTSPTPPWTIEDPRMLREQIRVADRAYQRLHDEHAQLKKRVEHLLEYARHMPTCPMPAKECDCGLKELMEELE